MTNTVAKKDDAKNIQVTKTELPLFQSLHNEMNRLFEEFTSRMHLAEPKWREPLTPFTAKVDVKDAEKELVVTAEIPGVNFEDIEVALRPDGLAICGEKKEEKEEKEKGYYKMERTYGSFFRLVPIPFPVEREEISASYKDGVLKVVLPKSKEILSNEKKIEVKKG